MVPLTAYIILTISSLTFIATCLYILWQFFKLTDYVSKEYPECYREKGHPSLGPAYTLKASHCQLKANSYMMRILFGNARNDFPDDQKYQHLITRMRKL
jgi:hypothetical protein